MVGGVRFRARGAEGCQFVGIEATVVVLIGATQFIATHLDRGPRSGTAWSAGSCRVPSGTSTETTPYRDRRDRRTAGTAGTAAPTARVW